MLTTVSRGLPSARGGTSLTIDGGPAAQTEVANGRGCVVDVALVDDDPDQLSSVSMLLGPNTPSALHTKACDLTDKVAGRIVDKLPG
ncbi:hypothetical protein AB0K15_03020 [Amycolatopsis sp. NPDC049253]|uniref:hypothetical protein n=1 Tax=Amycolatopsis sp. NPDC049253 TaxID=3155274 RepID=UPI0034490ACB